VVRIAGDTTLGRRANKIRQFQLGGQFIGAAGPVAPTDCSLATPFNFTDGTLSSGGNLVSTDLGIAYEPFWTLPTAGAITTTFALENDILVWSNVDFINFNAEFCQDDGGQVWAVFDAAAPPFNCAPVYLVAFAGKSSRPSPDIKAT
jgi:hypothetical protein